MKVVITGANGFVGQNLCMCLSYRTQIYEFNPTNIVGDAYHTAFHKFMESIPDDIDFIVHLGAISDSRCADPHMVYTNGIACSLVATYARRYGCCVVHVSSCAAIDPVRLYDWTKLAGEEFMRTIVPRKNLCVLRPFQIYGADESMKVNPSLVYKIKNEWDIPLYKNCCRDFVHVDDFCMIIKQLLRAKWQDGTYEVGTGVGISTAQLYELITGKDRPELTDLPSEIPRVLIAEKTRMLKDISSPRIIEKIIEAGKLDG